MSTLLESRLAQRLAQRRHPLSPVASLARPQLQNWLGSLLGLLFPHLESPVTPAGQVFERLNELERELASLLAPLPLDAPTVASRFFTEELPCLDVLLQEDAETIFQGDPAATSVDEVILTYPGLLAVAIYRLAHSLLKLEVPVVPRLLTEYAHQLTGVDIHPGAQIGRRFCIDHGTGVVIGESSVIGDDVKLYQGVTLGALSVEKEMARTKRHPTLEDRVVIYANATILGGKTVVGHDSVIGGNVWLTRSVEPFTLAYHSAQLQLRSQQDVPLDFQI
ncbi:MAG: serine O-acetyltransferase [Candidatus Sericytochromatia bacterium]